MSVLCRGVPSFKGKQSFFATTTGLLLTFHRSLTVFRLSPRTMASCQLASPDLFGFLVIEKACLLILFESDHAHLHAGLRSISPTASHDDSSTSAPSALIALDELSASFPLVVPSAPPGHSPSIAQTAGSAKRHALLHVHGPFPLDDDVNPFFVHSIIRHPATNSLCLGFAFAGLRRRSSSDPCVAHGPSVRTTLGESLASQRDFPQH